MVRLRLGGEQIAMLLMMGDWGWGAGPKVVEECVGNTYMRCQICVGNTYMCWQHIYVLAAHICIASTYMLPN